MSNNKPQRLSDSTILNDYPVATTVRYLSSSNPGSYLTGSGYVANSHDGMFDELEKIGVARTDPEEIPEKLVPIQSDRELFESRRTAGIVLERVEFNVFDVKRTEATLSNSVQVAAVNSAITNSLTFVNNVYAQTEALNGVPVDWIPNWFNPRVMVNGRNVEGTINNTFHPTHKGLNSLGGLTSYDREFALYFKSIENLEIFARCAQRIRTASGTIYYQPYAVMATVTFRSHW